MRRVPRHLFVEEAFRERAYGDHPLPIGQEQTISQPYIVALMTSLLELSGREKVLEVGTGSGYQTAVLAELARRVCSIERIPALAAAGAGRAGGASATPTCGCAWATAPSVGPTRHPSIASWWRRGARACRLRSSTSWSRGAAWYCPSATRPSQTLTLVENVGGQMRTRRLRGLQLRSARRQVRLERVSLYNRRGHFGA